MKNKVRDFIHSQGGSAHYSGKTKTMYIWGEKSETIEEKVLARFGLNLPFKLDGIPHLKKSKQ